MEQVIEQFPTKRILVIGDVMLDSYIDGTAERISPESPVPVIRYKSERDVPGGAANTAQNLAVLGAKVLLTGVVGDDHNSQRLKNVLHKNIDASGFVIEQRPTTLKQRVVSGGHQFIRIDQEIQDPISENTENSILSFIKSNINQCDGVIVSDYAKGVLTPNLSKQIVTISEQHNKPLVVDTKPKNVEHFTGAFLIKPNLKEAKEMTGKDDPVEAGQEMVRRLNANIIMTMGGNGCTVFEKDGKISHVPAKKIHVYDVSGAGDTFAVATILSLASGADLTTAAKIANHASSIVVQKLGTATVSYDEIKSLSHSEISNMLTAGIETKQRMLKTQVEKINQIVDLIIDTYDNDKKVVAFGNGGSACDALHLIGELVGRYKDDRKSLTAISLNADPAIMTCIGNDYGFENIFKRQVESQVKSGDLVIGYTTSGKSKNVIEALKEARKIGAKTVGMTGKDGGDIPQVCDIAIIVPSDKTAHIQEVHLALTHIMCELLDKKILGHIIEKNE